MADLKKEGLVVTQLELKSMGGENGFKVEIPIESAPYQGYLNAGRRMEEDRETYGEIRLESYNAYKAAVERLNEFVLATYLKNKSN